MNQLTFFDKIQVLFRLLFSSPIIIGIFAFSLFLMIMLFFSAKLNKKLVKYIFIGIYVLVIGFSIIKYGSYFLTSIDSFLTLFMANIYFPIIPIYVAIMIISFIIMIITLSGKHKSRFIKILNIVFFTIIQMLFVVFIYVIESNKIDLSTNTGLYSNEQTMTLLELGMGVFVIWIVLLLVILYLKKADKIFKVKKSEEQDDFDEYINDYNEPGTVVSNNEYVPNVNNSFNNNIVDALVPEAVSFQPVQDISNYQPIQNNSFHTDSVMSSNNFSNTDDLCDIESIDFDDDSTIYNEVNTISDNSANEKLDVKDSYINNNLYNEKVDVKDSYNNIDNSYSSLTDNMNSYNYSDVDTNINNSYINNISNANDDNSSLDNTNSYIDNNISNKVNPSVDDIFSNFKFLDIPSKPIERKNDDVEVIDFD